MLNNLLSPDKNNFLLKKYHISSKLLIPGIVTSYMLNKYDYKPYENVLHGINILNIGFHSYVSSSCIISDYIKPKSISTAFRGTNIIAHSFACFGYFYYLKKNY